MNLNTLYNKTNALIEEIREASRPVAAEQLGLDTRCYDLMLLCDEDGTPEAIVAVGSSAKRMLEYYGGFEYVNEDSVIRIEAGCEEYSITIYHSVPMTDDDRVSVALAYYAEHHASTDEEGDDLPAGVHYESDTNRNPHCRGPGNCWCEDCAD